MKRLLMYETWLMIMGLLCNVMSTYARVPLAHDQVQMHGLQELEFDALIKRCDFTRTVGGAAALRQLTVPRAKVEHAHERQELISYFLKKSDKHEQIIDALCAIARCDDSAQRYNVHVVDELFVSVRSLYYSFLPINLDNSASCLAVLHWLHLVGSPAILVLEGLFERYNVGRARQIRWVGAEYHSVADLGGGLFARTRDAVGATEICNKLNIFSSPRVGTVDQINRAARDVVWRNQILDDPQSTAADSHNALMAAFALQYYMKKFEEGDPMEVVEQLGLALEESIVDRFKRDSHAEFLKALASVTSYKNPGYPIAKMFGMCMMANDARLRIKQNVTLEHALWGHVSRLSQWVERVEQLATLLSEQAAFWHDAQALLHALNDTTVQEFFAAARAFVGGLTKSYQWLHHPGRVLHVHRCAERAAEKIEQIIEHIGVIDAWMSMVDTVQRYGLCQAQFVVSECATIQAKQLWSILLENNDAIKNDIALDDINNKMLITGPNGGGKSTVMKSVGQAALLAQSWGYAPADSFVCTPFHSIFVAMDSHQSIAASLSTYMSELYVLNQIVSMAQTCKERGQHCLVFLDEPCRGSIEIESAKRITAFCSDIDVYDNVAALMATHMYGPALEAERLHSWINQQLGYVFTGSQVRRTFSLLPGIAHWWFTDAEKRAQFLSHLSQVVSTHSEAAGNGFFSDVVS